MPTMKEIIDAIESDLATEKLALTQSQERVRVARIRIKKALVLLRKLKPLVEEIPVSEIKVEVVEDGNETCSDCGRVFASIQGLHHHQTVSHSG